MKYRRFPPCFIVKNGIHGLGVFTTANIKKGQILSKLNGKILNAPTRTSVQIGKNKHIEDEMAGYINHSCEPTAEISRKTRLLISLRAIRKGEEITFNYNKNEEVLFSPFTCQCCGRKIVGKKFLRPMKSL